MSRESNEHNTTLTRRAFLLGGIKLTLSSILVGRLYYLQIRNEKRFNKLSDNNRIQTQYLKPKRGRILDALGMPLAYEKPCYQCIIEPRLLKKHKKDISKIMNLAGLDKNKKEHVLNTFQQHYLPKEMLLKDKLSFEEVVQLENLSVSVEGVRVEKGFRRFYENPNAFCHILGYVGASQDNQDPAARLVKDFKVGKSGLERQYDETLRGQFGSKEVEVDAKGHFIQTLSTHDAWNGDDITLTVDGRLQDYVFNRLKEHISATAVVMNAKNGAIHSMVSFPGFDTNAMTHGLSHDMWQSIVNDPGKPLHNKAIAGLYPPASTIKMVVLLSALKQGIITPHTHFQCQGHTQIGNQRFHCWQRFGHGRVSLERAITQSCDVYFYEIAKRIDMDKLAETFREFGFGAPTSIDLLGESKGVVPDRSWKERIMGRKWNMGETVNTCIGQGYFLATPIQLCVMMARLLYPSGAATPHLLQNPTLKIPENLSLSVDHKHVALIKSFMDRTANHPSGSLFKVRSNTDDAVIFSGKTGTAQVRRIRKKDRESGSHKLWEWKNRDHSLFVGYSTIKNPHYIACVVVEHGGWGSRVAAPLGRDILQKAEILLG
jgi:penicillin-binding protein 2